MPLARNHHSLVSVRRSAAKLYAVHTPEDAWESVLQPWFETMPPRPETFPRLVLTPDTALLSWIKRRLTEARKPCFGVHFWTPGRLREHLLSLLKPPCRLARAEDLTLVARLSLSDLPADNAQAASLCADPTALIETHDTLTAAGYPVETLSDPQIVEFLRRYENKLEAMGLWTRQQADRWLLSQDLSISFAGMVAWGFSAATSAHDSLLQAAIGACRESCLLTRADADSLQEMAWLGTWEERLGEAQQPTLSHPSGGLETLAHAIEAAAALPHNAPVQLLLAEEPEREAQRIVHTIVRWLGEVPDGLLGIVVPAGSHVARRVSALLCALELPHHDSLGHYGAQPLPQRLLEAWAAWQTEGTVARWHRYSQQAVEANLLSQTALNELIDQFNASRNILLSNQYIHYELLLKRHTDLSAEARHWLKQCQSFVEEDSLEVYIKQFTSVLELLGFDHSVIRDYEENCQTVKGDPVNVSSNVFIDWSVSNIKRPGKSRYPLARNGLSRIHIVDPWQAQFMSFEQTMLGGLNETLWPTRVQRQTFISESFRQQRNIESLARGSMGEGHWVQRHGWLARGTDYARQSQEAFYRIIAATRQRVAVSASRQIVQGEDSAGPSELWMRTARSVLGRLPDERTLEQLAQAPAGLISPITDSASVAQTLTARHTRMDDTAPLGIYDCVRGADCGRRLYLSATAWQDVFKQPLRVWIEHVLRQKPSADFSGLPASSVVVGKWVHTWLLDGLQADFQPMASLPPCKEKIETRAAEEKTNVEALFAAAQSEPPLWWEGYWQVALRKAESFAAGLDQLVGWTECAAEQPLGKDASILIEDQILPVYGRMDLVLRQTKGDRTFLWIIDFKTGNPTNVTPETLAKKADGLQIALYTRALAEMADEVRGCLWFDTEAPPEGLSAEQFALAEGFWQGLAELQRKGVLGGGAAQGSRYHETWEPPRATLSVPHRIWEARWQLTYPNLPTPC